MSNWKVMLVRTLVRAVTDRPAGAQASPSRPLAEESAQRHKPAPASPRRLMTGLLSLTLLVGAGLLFLTGRATAWTGSESTGAFVVAAMTRIGLVTGAFWLAWDSLRKPAKWLPPGIAALGIGAIVVVAVQPRMVLALAPAIGVLSVLFVITKAIRRR